MRAADCAALVEKPAHLDQHQRQAQLAVGEAVALQVAAPQLARVLLLDVAEVERRRRLVLVEQRVGLLAVLPVQPRLDPLADGGEVVERDQAAGVLLDEGALGGEADPHVADLALRVLADARREVREEALAGRQMVGAADVDDDAQVLKPGHAAAQLLNGDHAGGVARQQLLDVAAQVAVERGGPPGRRDRRQQRQRPEQRPMAKRPGDEAAGEGAGRGWRWIGGHVGWAALAAADDTEELAQTPESPRVISGSDRPHAMVSGRVPFVPDRAGFLDLARRGRIAFVYREVLADTDTPVSAYAKLGRGPYSFLLESVVGGDKWAAYSFAGVRPRAVVRARGADVEVLTAAGGELRVTERVARGGPAQVPGRLPGQAGAGRPAWAAALLRRRGRLARLRRHPRVRADPQHQARRARACPRSASPSPTRWSSSTTCAGR